MADEIHQRRNGAVVQGFSLDTLSHRVHFQDFFKGESMWVKSSDDGDTPAPSTNNRGTTIEDAINDAINQFFR